MKCPKCNSFNVQVVTTKKTVEGPFETVRRRNCRSCDYRWYTAQEPEVFIGPYLQWEGDQVRVTLPALNS
jgi:transcriptional regulator NrdR family protein